MNELQAVKSGGAITSLEIHEMFEKSRRAIIRQLNSLELRGMIKIIIFKSKINRVNLYISNEVFNNLCKVKK